MSATTIQWTDVTDNIIAVNTGGWWCRKISPGCDNCYAEALNQKRFFGGNGLPYRGAPPMLTLRDDLIESWARQRKAKRHFVASMTDVFGEWVPQGMIWRFLDGMAAAPLQIFQLLTKRPGVMAREVSAWLCKRDLKSCPANIWLGVTVENQEQADKRIPALLRIPAQVRFLSCEPLLGEVDLSPWIRDLSWVICGGESGPKARPMHPDWLMRLRDQCQAAGAPVFIKQLGNHLARQLGCRDPKGGDPSEWPAEYRVRQFPNT
jgi:protein gp37